MKDFINKIIKKVFSKEFILYGIFGVITTLVNIGCFAVFNRIFALSVDLSNILSISIAIIVAYLTNRKIVFGSTAKTFKDILAEIYKFILARIVTMFIEFYGVKFLYEVLHIDSMISKISITVLVIILNYIFSKLFVFKKK